MRVLLVTDRAAASAYLHKALRECAYSVLVIDGLVDGFHVASEENFDTIVVMCTDYASHGALLRLLPGLSALGCSPGAMLILSKASASERIAFLRAGADACFVQPYAFAELHERMQATLRLNGRSQRGIHAGGSIVSEVSIQSSVPETVPASLFSPRVPREKCALRLDDDTHRLTECDRSVKLSVGEYLFVKCLMRAIDVPVSRDQLILYAWPGRDDVGPATVGLVASRLRRKMFDAHFSAQIETVPRFGYRLSLL